MNSNELNLTWSGRGVQAGTAELAGAPEKQLRGLQDLQIIQKLQGLPWVNKLAGCAGCPRGLRV